jgi:hypothetical protein
LGRLSFGIATPAGSFWFAFVGVSDRIAETLWKPSLREHDQIEVIGQTLTPILHQLTADGRVRL